MVVGATSGAGKSTVTAGLCRSWARRNVRVAPFKAQNMSNHSAVAVDGGEVGRAQAAQAAAAGVDVESAMNPILLKPADDRTSHVVVRGVEVGRTGAHDWGAYTRDLRSVVLDDLASLRTRFEMVVCEGAGGAGEINLFDRDLVNLPLAAAAGIPAVVVVDIDRGGGFASAFGTIELLPDHLRAMVAGVIFNRFRGEESLLVPGIEELERRSGIPVLGVLPHLGPEPLFGVEDSLDVDTPVADRAGSVDPLRVAVVRLPRLANPSDLDPLRAEPDVTFRWATTPGAVADADVVVVPGSRSTVADLDWIRNRGIDVALDAVVARGGHVVGICAGAQMLGTSIVDGVESCVAAVDGLGLLSLDTRFEPGKVVRRRSGRVDGHPVHGYQIHQGRTSGGPAWVTLDTEDEPGSEHRWEGDGAIGHDGRVRATTLHGIFDSDEFRTAWLVEMASRSGRTVTPSCVGFADRLDRQAERLADWVDDALSHESIDAIAAAAVPAGGEPGW